MPKKIYIQNPRNPQTPSMSSPHPYTVSTPVHLGSLPEDDEDEDDICPVCESECTCRNRANPVSSARSAAPTLTSTSTSITSSHSRHPPPQTGGHVPSLKIRLTVPPNLKFRRDNAAALQNDPSAETTHAVNQPVDPVGPKRRGRPPKAVVAAREAARAALAASHSGTSDYSRAAPLKIPFSPTPGSLAVIKSKSQPLSKKALANIVNSRKKSHGKGVAVPTAASSLSTLTDSDGEPQFPTFVSAASTSSLTSSSESSDIDSDSLSSDSDIADEEHFIIRSQRDKARVRKELLGDDVSQKRRDHAPGNRWEIKPRKKSVSAGESDTDGGDSDDSTDEEEEADDEDDGEENDVDEVMGGEDVLDEPDAVRDPDEYDGKLGVSFHGVPSGWSESDDEESSFDAELFFANLDDTSDTCSSPIVHNDEFASDFNSSELDIFSADEDDALLLMDIDPSAQIRRTPGEFEVGVDLDSLSFGLDGHLLPSPFGPFDADVVFDGSTESDVEMTASDGGMMSDDESDELALVETDGETTEDELVDSDGLPNSRAMMLFRWPNSVSTVDPLSTMSPGVVTTPPTPTHTSQTTRMALASMPLVRSSPAPTPADILAGKISMDDLDDIEISGELRADVLRSSASSSGHLGVPVMGQFVAGSTTNLRERHAIIDGSGELAPSPFPRSRILRAKRRQSTLHQSTSTVDFSTDLEGNSHRVPVSFVSIALPFSDEPGSQTQVQTSDEPPSTDVIELDDVLDASFLDSEPATFESDAPSQDPCTPRTPATYGSHMKSLTRWDRIPVATFRRTRQTPLIEGTPVSDSRFPNMGALVNNDMLATPKPTAKSKSFTSGSVGKRSKGKASVNLLVVSPVLMPVRDGDRTPTNAGSSGYSPFHDPLHQQKSRRDQRKEKAMLKKKMMSKYANSSSRQQHHHRPHYPNMKSRGSGSMQRTQFFASSSHVPHLNI